MRVGILGSGLMGGKLGTIFARAGHEVVFSYARSRERLTTLSREAGGKARAGTPSEAAAEADALLLAVHWSRIDDVLKQAGDLSGKVIVTCSLPMNASNTGLVIAHTSSGAEALAKRVPNARVVLRLQHRAERSAVRRLRGPAKVRPGPASSTAETTRAARRSAAELIADAGFDPVDAGPLRIARYTEPFALLIGQLAYEGEGGPELAYRFERYGR